MYAPPFQFQKPQRPKLQSFVPFDSASSSSSQSSPSSLYDSCQALQTMIVTPSQSQTPWPLPTIPCPTKSTKPRKKNQQLPPRISGPCRSGSKRSRDEFEDCLELELNTDFQISIDEQTTTTNPNLFQTPKRQCSMTGSDLPLTLNPSDFDLMDTPFFTSQPYADDDFMLHDICQGVLETSGPLENPMSMHTQTQQTQTQMQMQTQWPCLPQNPDDWTQWMSMSMSTGMGMGMGMGTGMEITEDDPRIIESVMAELHLSNQNLNDYTRQLCKDKDSLDEQWRSLLGQVNIGLKRAAAVTAAGRMDVEVKSW